MFNEDNGLVKVWVRLINEGKRTTEEVPDLLNLRDVVGSLVAQ